MFGLEMMTFNYDDGYCESIVRALGKGLLRKDEYEALCHCNNIEEFRLQMEETDYKAYLVQEEAGQLDSTWLKKKLYTKLRDELQYIMGQASQPL